ncbi:hypothetical protein ACQPYE_15715 [Actinosynnema sp. CA-299493]
MSVPEPVPVLVETLGAVPPVGPEELTQGYGLTELGAAGEDGECECGCGLGREVVP